MTDKPKATQADRVLFGELFLADELRDENSPSRHMLNMGAWDDSPRMQILARHRIAAEQSRDAVIEECVKVVEGFVDPHAAAMKQHQARAIAFTLRNLKGKKS